MLTYQVIRTRTGRHYVKVFDGDRQIYVTRGAFTSAEPAITEARNHINGTPETEAEPEPFWRAWARKLQGAKS